MQLERGATEPLDALLRAATNHAILLTDPSGTLTMFNEGAERLLGYRAVDVVGIHSPDLFFERGELTHAAAELGVRPRYTEIVSAAVRANHWTRDWLWLTAAGEPIVVRLSVTAVAAPDGTTEAFLGIATDVTPEVQATADLQAEQERWQTLLNSMPGTVVMVLDDELRCVTAAGESLGQSRDTLVGRSIFDFLSTEDATELELVARGALDGEKRSAEATFASGSTYSLVAVPVEGARGRPEALVIAHDVTTDRRREQSLRAAEERFRRLFDEAPNGTALLDLDGRFIHLNPTLGRLLGREPDSLIGQRATDLAAADSDADSIGRYLTELVAAPDGRLSGDWTVRRTDGQPAHLSASGVVLLDESGEPESVLLNLLDISARRKAEQRLEHLAGHDPLTGLANRRRFNQELAAHLDRSRRYGPSGALMVLDLDHFKDVNDTMGHAAGDQLIVAAADALRNRLRTSDVIARLGGDEFAVLLPNVDRAAAERVAASVVQLVRNEVKVFGDTASHAVTTSIGVVLIGASNATTDELLAEADRAMYEAKQSGRDRFVLSDALEPAPEPVTAIPSWGDRIALALSEQRLLLHAQPLLDLRTGRYYAAEVLVRMLYEDGELILPDRFLHVAERVGLMPSIDLWVVSQTLEWLQRLSTESPNFQLHVNISPASMGDEKLLSRIQDRVIASGVDPSRLVFEMSEAAAASKLEAARMFTDRMSELGCQVALEDFSGGVGSLYYLKHLHFDAVKVGGDLLTRSVGNKTDRMILQTVLELARSLGKRTIAEAVEDSAMMEAVVAEGLDLAQGYHIQRPERIEDILEPVLG